MLFCSKDVLEDIYNPNFGFNFKKLSLSDFDTQERKIFQPSAKYYATI